MQLDGYFNARGEPAIQLDLGGVNLEVLIDTGFAGWLIVPANFDNTLGLRCEGFEEFTPLPDKLSLRRFVFWTSIGSISGLECQSLLALTSPRLSWEGRC